MFPHLLFAMVVVQSEREQRTRHLQESHRSTDAAASIVTLLANRQARLAPENAANALALLEELTFRCRALSLLPAAAACVTCASDGYAMAYAAPESPPLALDELSVASPASDAPAAPLCALPSDVLVRILAALPTVEDLGRADCVCHGLHDDAVEEALRLRAAAAGLRVPETLPEGETSWTQKLCWDERRRRFGRPSVVAGGMYHSLILDASGRLLSCGNATLDGGRPGLLGHGAAVEHLDVPRPVPSLLHMRIRTLAAAEFHSLALSESGAAYSWGYGALGRLGHGDEADRHAPCRLQTPGGPPPTAHDGAPSAAAEAFFTAASAGSCHTLLLSASGVAYSCGYGGSGRLGLGEALLRGRPLPTVLAPRALEGADEGACDGVCEGARVGALLSLRAVAAGTHHTLVLSHAGAVYSCGEGGLGQLGHCEDESCWRPRRVAGALEGVACCAVAAGRLHSLALSDDGVVYSWGEGDDGRLGHGHVDSCWSPSPIRGPLSGRRVCEVSTVWDHSLALTADGLVFSWGLGLCGQLGHGDEEQNELSPRLLEGLTGTRVVGVAAGARTCFAAATDGCLFGWGVGVTTEDDLHGLSHRVSTLGLGLEKNQCEPVQYLGLRVHRRELRRG